ncbi:MAG: ATP-dependent Clp protease proteolytic subunit, partial [Phycisphaerales bacterium]
MRRHHLGHRPRHRAADEHHAVAQHPAVEVDQLLALAAPVDDERDGDRDLWLDAQEMLAYGLIDRVIERMPE